MPRLNTQKQFRGVQRLPFCYVCGEGFDDESPTKDHVPAKACFALEDRDYPLLLPTHAKCNCDHHVIDELIGQLIGLRRGSAPEPSKRRLTIRAMNDANGGIMGGVNNLDIPTAIKRWIGAFHAALYSEHLPLATLFAMETPFALATSEDGRVTFQGLRDQHRTFIAVLKRQRAANNTDGIRCNNGKLIYECVWDRIDDWGWLCIFGLDVYGWADLGDTKRFQRRGCAGSYILPERRLPDSATRAGPFQLDVPNTDPFDPFGS